MKSALAVPLFSFLLFLPLSLPFSVVAGKNPTEHAGNCSPLPSHSLLPSLPGLEAAVVNTKTNIDMHGGETRSAVAPLKVFQMTRSQSHRCSHSRSVSPVSPVPNVPTEGPDCLRLAAFSFFPKRLDPIPREICRFVPACVTVYCVTNNNLMKSPFLGRAGGDAALLN